MANSFVQYTGDGATVVYTVTFPFLSRSHVTVRLDGASTTAFTWLSDSQIQFSAPPTNGVLIDIRRSSSPTAALVDFSDGARLKESDLDTAFLQTFYLAQEANEGSGGSIALAVDGTWDAGSRRIKNINVPINGSDAATKSYVDTAITDLPVSLDGSGNIDGEARRLTNLANGLIASDAVTKAQLDAVVVAVGSVPTPADPTDNGKALMASAGAYSWQTIGSFLPLSGGTLTGALGVSNGADGSLSLGPSGHVLLGSASGLYLSTQTSVPLYLGVNGSSYLIINTTGQVEYHGPTPTLTNNVVPKSYVDAADSAITASLTATQGTVTSNTAAISSLSTTVAGKAGINSNYDWVSVWSGSTAGAVALLANWGHGIYKVTTGVRSRTVATDDSGTTVDLDGVITWSGDSVIDAVNLITAVHKLRKLA